MKCHVRSPVKGEFLKMFKKVVIGISGGVDSAVAAVLLKKKGFNVHGVFMQNWDIRDERGACSSEEDYADAQFVCDKLNIDLHHANFVKEYWNEVFFQLIQEYESGFTPNPDILCNRNIKFNYFYKFALDKLNADAIATGHYAKTSFGPYLEDYQPEKDVRLLLAKDRKKDQTFFLCQVKQEPLRKTMFPLCDITKSEVKHMAIDLGLEKIATKPESMGICFIGSRNFQSFIQEYISDKPGNFVDIDSGKVVGQHNGVHQWTLGQRTKLPGLPIAYFTARKDVQNNIVYVAQGTNHPILNTDLFFTHKPHWIYKRPDELNSGDILECQFKFQHTQNWLPCQVCETELGLTVKLFEEIRAITGGQYAVFSRNGECLGPRWASWNIGVFLCIRCAGIHRNLGVHISKVKSVNLDSWTPEQVVSLQQMGNSRARAVYEANLPDNFRRPQSDSSLETFIRAKYEHKKYIAREWVPPVMPKVNWEKEIDEEIEKQKRKKKTIVERKSLGSVEVPQLPKPTNPSPKPARSINSNVDATKEKKDKKDSDLLGLQNGDDSFSGFVSAPTTVEHKPEKPEPQPDLAKNEEESFFNQVIPVEKEKVKLDKNSILALYANGPTNNFNQFQQATYPPAQQPPFPAFGNFQQQPQPTFPLQNGMSQLPNHWPQQQWGKQAQFAGVPAQGQMQFAMPGAPQVSTQFAANSTPPAFPQPAAPGQFYQPPFPAPGGSFGQAQAQSQPPNQFFAAQNLRQQFGALNLNNQPANAGNAWQ